MLPTFVKRLLTDYKIYQLSVKITGYSKQKNGMVTH